MWSLGKVILGARPLREERWNALSMISVVPLWLVWSIKLQMIYSPKCQTGLFTCKLLSDESNVMDKSKQNWCRYDEALYPYTREIDEWRSDVTVHQIFINFCSVYGGLNLCFIFDVVWIVRIRNESAEWNSLHIGWSSSNIHQEKMLNTIDKSETAFIKSKGCHIRI